jgi:oligopeptide transport system permease protein
MGGAIVTERIFNINGIGTSCTGASARRTARCRRHLTCLVLIYLFVNLLVDILYGFSSRISHD